MGQVTTECPNFEAEGQERKGVLGEDPVGEGVWVWYGSAPNPIGIRGGALTAYVGLRVFRTHNKKPRKRAWWLQRSFCSRFSIPVTFSALPILDFWGYCLPPRLRL